MKYSVFFSPVLWENIRQSEILVFFSPFLWENIRQSEIFNLFQSCSVGEYLTE